MNDKGCVIVVNGDDYYYPCDSRDYLIYTDNSIINTSSDEVILYSSFPEFNDDTTGYPRIVCPSNHKCYYRQDYNSTPVQLTVNDAYFKSANLGIMTYLLIILACIMIVSLFKR